MNRYYSLRQEGGQADIYIYGDITSWDWNEKDMSSYTLSKRLQGLEDVTNINVYINSYGGEVAEGLAIYNALKRHKAKITTIVDGFACSIASVIFAAGDERVMSNTSLLMIHNAWTHASGDANDFKKQAEDLEKVTQASVNAYMNIVTIDEDELKEMLDDETWLDSDEAVAMSFATKAIEKEEGKVATQSIRNAVMKRITKEPEKVAIANVSYSEEDLKEIVNNLVENLEIKLLSKSEEGSTNENKDKTNKPLNMMKAIFK